MDPVIATLIILAIVTIGEVVSILSKAKIPTLLVILIIVLIAFQTNIIPEGIVEASTFTIVGAVLQPAILVHMGTLIPISVLKSQYKAVIISLIGIIFAVISVLLIVPFIFDYGVAVAGTGPLTGGLIAYLITEEGLQAAGLSSLIAIPVIILAAQGLVGMPLSSILLQKYGKKYRDNVYNGNDTSNSTAAEEVLGSESDKKLLIPQKYLDSNFILLFMIFIGGALAVWLDSLTGINYSLFGLVIGILGSYIGFYPRNVLEKANGFSIAILGLIVIVLSGMIGLTWSMILSVLPAIITIVIIGSIGLCVGGFIGSKLVKWDPLKGIPISLTAMYGFPGDYLISHEVSRSVGRDDKEKEAILNHILAPMLIGGFTSVSFGSIVIASILIKTL